MKNILTTLTICIILTSCNHQDKLKVVLVRFPNDSIQEVIYYDLPITSDSAGTKEIYFDNGKLQAKDNYKNVVIKSRAFIRLGDFDSIQDFDSLG